MMTNNELKTNMMNHNPSETLSEPVCKLVSFPVSRCIGEAEELSQEPVEGITEGSVEFKGRRTSVTLLGDEFINETVKKRSVPAEPIKKVEDIWKVQQCMISEHRYRDNLLFTCGVNFGLRIGDLLSLKVGHLIDKDGSYNPKIEITEEKTKKTRVVYLNDAVMDAADLYFNDLQARRQPVFLNDFLFRSASNRKGADKDHLTIRSADRLLKETINKKCGIDIHASTHCLRKTFAYHVIIGAQDRSRAVEFLQKIFGHSSSAITLLYAGITDDEIQATYQNLNLGISATENHGFNWTKSSGYAYRKAQ